MGVYIFPPALPVNQTGALAQPSPVFVAGNTAVSATAAANTAVTITIPGVAGQQIRLTHLSYELSTFVAATGITVVSNAVTLWQATDLAAGLVSVPLPDGGLLGAVGQSMVITLAAGGAGSVGTVNAAYLQR